jgi:ABC-type spermidine/putrescine transport system permease subunit I
MAVGTRARTAALPTRWAGRARRQLGRVVLVLPSVGWTAVFFGVPLAMLIAYSFGQIDIITFQVSWGWTLDSYDRVFEALYLKAIGRSLLLSAVATLGCLVVGFPAAYYISQQRGRRQLILLVAVMVPFWTSFLVRTYAMTNVLGDGGPVATVYGWLGGESLGLLYSPTAVALGILYSYLPLMILPLYVALERIDPSLRDAASDLGATSWRRLRRVVVPLAMPGIIAGCILVGVPSTGEYVVPQILGGGKVLMYGNVVADQFQNTGDYPFGAALSVTLMAILTIVVLLTRRAGAGREARA